MAVLAPPESPGPAHRQRPEAGVHPIVGLELDIADARDPDRAGPDSSEYEIAAEGEGIDIW